MEFKNPYLLRETKEDKEEILDIKASLDNNIQCDIEIQKFKRLGKVFD